jgi:hypothetical protein
MTCLAQLDGGTSFCVKLDMVLESVQDIAQRWRE